MQGRQSERVRAFRAVGDTTGEDRRPTGCRCGANWAAEYSRGGRWWSTGHTPVLEPIRVQRSINIDTGCVFRRQGSPRCAYPEQELISVAAGPAILCAAPTVVDEPGCADPPCASVGGGWIGLPPGA